MQADFDFFDLKAFSKATPYAALARLREDEPVSWQPLPSSRTPNDGFWLVTKHEDIVAIAQDSVGFHSNSGTLLMDHPPAGAPAPWSMIKSEFCSLDGETHRLYRGLMTPRFGPKAVADLEVGVRQLATQYVDLIASKGELNFAEDVAVRYPVSVVLGLMMGIPEEDQERAAYWSDVITAPEDPDFGAEPGAAVGAIAEMYDYAVKIVRERRADPGEDLISMLAHAKLADGTPISDEMFTHFFWSMILGSFDTTASTISTGLQALSENPDELEKLRRSPELLHSAVEEMLRYTSAVVYFRRTVTEDTVYRGIKMTKGQRVALCFAAGNRDPEVFENPNRFDITRTPNRHLAFGFGRHFCLGARLARLELRCLFEELLIRRKAEFECKGEVLRTHSNFLNRIKEQTVTFRFA